MMKRAIFNPTHPVAATAVCLAGLAAVASVNLQAKDIQLGRYSVLAATPTESQIQLLQVVRTEQFPAAIETVGQAVRQLLQGSGYRLADEIMLNADTVALFDLPLPAAHRQLGPMTVKAALETLAGPAFNLVEDPVHRLVSFERCVVLPGSM